jgi:hypothetical protein
LLLTKIKRKGNKMIEELKRIHRRLDESSHDPEKRWAMKLAAYKNKKKRKQNDRRT